MGFLDKVKNLFTEEEEVYEEPIKKEVIKVEIPAPEVAKPQKESPVLVGHPEPQVEPRREEAVAPKKAAPVFFDDKDFESLDRKLPKKEVKPKREEKKAEPKKAAYQSYQMNKPKLHDERKLFKPSPIISPVYGVLDKNYHKDDIVPRRENRVDMRSGELTIDDVRKKAYGTLEDEIDATLFEEPVKTEEEVGTTSINGLEDDIFKDLEIDMGKEDLEMEETIDTHDVVEDDNEFQLEDNTLEEENKDSDNLVEEAMNMGIGEEVIIDKDEETAPEEDLEDSDLFNLIDSMYEKRDEADE